MSDRQKVSFDKIAMLIKNKENKPKKMHILINNKSMDKPSSIKKGRKQSAIIYNGYLVGKR